MSSMFNFNRIYIADFDWALFCLALAVAAFGVLEISSVEPTPGLWRRPFSPRLDAR